jgi:hypothetical protein
MIIVTDNLKQGARNDTSYLTFVPIKSGKHLGKFATSENALLEFPELFKTIDYQIIELDPSVFQVNTTPPPLLPFACIIPIGLQLPFRNGLFRLSGFEVPLESIGDNKVVNIAYLHWAEFKAELDRKYPDDTFVHQGIKDNLMDLWDFVELHAKTIEPWMADPVNNQLSEFIIYTP